MSRDPEAHPTIASPPIAVDVPRAIPVRIRLRPRHQPCAHGIVQQIARNPPPILLRAQGTIVVRRRPQRRFVDVDTAGDAARHRLHTLHQSSEGSIAPELDEQMGMVGHQDPAQGDGPPPEFCAFQRRRDRGRDRPGHEPSLAARADDGDKVEATWDGVTSSAEWAVPGGRERRGHAGNVANRKHRRYRKGPRCGVGNFLSHVWSRLTSLLRTADLPVLQERRESRPESLSQARFNLRA